MLVRGSILLAALLTVASSGVGVAANNAAPIKEIAEDVIDGHDEQVVNYSRELQTRYGSQPNYPNAPRYNEARKNTSNPTPKPSPYSAPSGNGTRRSGLRVYTEKDGREYVMRYRNGVANKVYKDEAGWDAPGSGIRRQRTGNRTRAGNAGQRMRNRFGNRNGNQRNGNGRVRRNKPDDWSAPAPANDWSATTSKPTPKPSNKWTSGSSGWQPKPETPSYGGGYNRRYHDPTLSPTITPTWDNDGYCVEPFKSTCCNQGDNYSYDKKQSLCKKLNCDISICGKNGDTWRSGNEPTAVPTWDTDGHKPTDMPTWETDAWDGDQWKCSDAGSRACCGQTEGDEQTKIEICNKLSCDWNECKAPSEVPSAVPSWSPSVSFVPTQKCSKEEQDRCCSQHESKSLEVKVKTCQQKFGCSFWKCPEAREGDDGWNGDSHGDDWGGDDWIGDDWSDDGHDDDTCSANEMAKCCEQHDGISLYKQQQICKHVLGCNLLKCSKHRQSEYADNYHKDQCSTDDKISCCGQDPDKPFDVQYSFCSKRGCDLHKCDENSYEEDDSEKKENKWTAMDKPKFQFGYGGDESTCNTGAKMWRCCSPERSLLGSYKAVVKNCQDLGCEWDQCPQNRDVDFYDNQTYDDADYEYGGGYDSNDKCTDDGKWSCCYPDESLTNLKAWVKNCERNNCEWRKCPHHKQGYFDPMEPTVKKDTYDEPSTECTDKEQMKCCTFQGTLKQAAKSCQDSGCDIAHCNNHDGNGYFIDNYNNNHNYNDPGYSIEFRNDQVHYGNGPNVNTGPKPGADVDYGGYGNGDNKPQGNKGPKLYGDGNSGNNNDNNERQQGNKGSRNGTDKENFMGKDNDEEDCVRETTSGGACRETCTKKVEYTLMGVVLSSHEETYTKACN